MIYHEIKEYIEICLILLNVYVKQIKDVINISDLNSKLIFVLVIVDQHFIVEFLELDCVVNEMKDNCKVI